jgi:hypothetical protein
VYGQTTTPEEAFPHVIKFLSALLQRRKIQDSDAILLDMAEKLTWFDVPAEAIREYGPRYYRYEDMYELFGAVLPDNHTIIYFMSSDNDGGH